MSSHVRRPTYLLRGFKEECIKRQIQIFRKTRKLNCLDIAKTRQKIEFSYYIQNELDASTLYIKTEQPINEFPYLEGKGNGTVNMTIIWWNY